MSSTLTLTDAAAALLKVWNAIELNFPDISAALGNGRGAPAGERHFEVVTWTQVRTDATRNAIATLIEALSAGTDLDAAVSSAVEFIECRAELAGEVILERRSERSLPPPG